MKYLFLALLFLSCGRDDYDPHFHIHHPRPIQTPEPASQLIGVWQLSEYVVFAVNIQENFTLTQVIPPTIENPVIQECRESGSLIDHDLGQSSGSFTVTSLNGECPALGENTYDYSIVSNNLTLTEQP